MKKRLVSLLAAACVLGVAPLAQSAGRSGNAGEISLQSGFGPVPRSIAVQAGGYRFASGISRSCAGLIGGDPTLKLSFTSSSRRPLHIGVMAQQDTTLLIRAPNGLWYCDDDGWGNQDPLVSFEPAMSGTYEIWVGSYERERTVGATVMISEARNPRKT